MPGKVGLTGGIGSGKSTVSEMFKSLGVFTIDADSIAKELSQPGNKTYDEIVEYFGSQIVDPMANIDRSRLAALVFSDEPARKRLEAILHPPIRTLMHTRCEQSHSPYCILEIPLLIETDQHLEMDRVLVVTSKPETRIARLHQTRNMSTTTIQRILDAQLSDEQRIDKADDVLNNDGTIAQLKKQAADLHTKYLEIFRS